MLDKEQVRKQVDISIEKLPNLSPSALKIIEIANDIKASPVDLMQIIKIDPVLTGKILRLINSTYFSMPQKITSLNRALILLGLNTIKNIALTSAFIEASGNRESNDFFDLKELWQHMLSVGVTSKLMAKAAGQSAQLLEEFFIAGLLHDVGDMIFMKYAPAEFYEIGLRAEAEKISVTEASRKILGFTGPEVGMRVAAHWKLADNLSKVISDNCHHGPDSFYLAKVINVGDKHCRKNRLGYVRDTVGCEIAPEELQEIGLSPESYEKVSLAVPEEVQKASVFLEAK